MRLRSYEIERGIITMRYNMLEHARMAEMKTGHPDWLWNRSDTHVILGVPGSLDAFKTPVEPGNSFSPGPGTYGISTWIFTDGKLHAPEEKCIDELEWTFEEGHLPVLHSKWQAGDVMVSSCLFADGNLAASDLKDYLTVALENSGEMARELTFYLTIRSFGASGGPIRQLACRNGVVFINDAPLIFSSTLPTDFGAVSYAESGRDISCFLRTGVLPDLQEVHDDSTWASGAIEYKITLEPGARIEYDFIFHLHAGHWMLNWIKPPERPFHIREIREEFISRWKHQLTIKLDLPDRRFMDAFYCQLVHLYMFTVHNSPRIAPISYPIWWLRDGAYVVNALNKGGFHDFCEQACVETAPRDTFGGFGSEGDAPGEVIWILSEHYLLTKDKEFLKKMFPHIQRKAELLIRMRNTVQPVKILSEFCIPQIMLEPIVDMLCAPSQDGLIIGRMDNHMPIIWVNSFAYLGLVRTAMCARELGLDDSVFENEADELKKALIAKSREIFGQNDRDVNCAFWPTGWASPDDDHIMGKFDEFWETVRCPGGIHQPEPMWTYFEAGQAHNNILIGMRDRAWMSIEMFLSEHTSPGLYTYHEGKDDENSAQLWQRTRGWDDIHYVTPHGWTAAELFLLLRDCLVREDAEGLVIGSGIPESWLDKDFSVEGIPTYHGKVSFWFRSNEKELLVRTDGKNAIKLRHDLTQPVSLRLEC